MKKTHIFLFLLSFLTYFVQTQNDYSLMTKYELDNALSQALQSGNYDLAKELVQAGADINQIITTWETIGRGEGCWDYDHREPLFYYAAKHGDSNTVKGILKIKYNIEGLQPKQIKQNSSATIYSYIYATIIAYMFKSQKPEPKNEFHDEVFYALNLALSNGHLNIVKELLQVPGIYENRKINFWLYNTALVEAAKYGRLNIVKELLQANSNINYADENGDTALIAAAEHSHVDVVKKLIQSNANVNLTNKNGNTALMAAMPKGRLKVVQELIQAKTNINSVNRDGDTALTIAASHGYDSEIKELIKAKANINHANKNGDTALILAINSQSIDTVQALLESKEIKINHANKDGNTALMVALKYIRTSYIAGNTKQYNACVNSQKIAEMILQVPGINPYLANNQGETAISLLDKYNQSARH